MTSESPTPPSTVVDVFNLPAIVALRDVIRQRHQKHRDAVAAHPDAPRLPTWSMAAAPELDLLQLPHALAAAFDAVLRLETAQAELIERRIKKGPPNAGMIEMVLRDEAYPLTFAIDNFLESAVRAQDGAWWYITKAFGRPNLGRSLRGAIENLRESKFKDIPPEVGACVVAYGDEGGLALRDYRDLAQHWGVVTSDVRITFGPDGIPLMYLALPSDPTTKSPLDFRYDSPVVLAYPYCRDRFLNMVRWLYKLADLVAPSRSGLATVPHFLTTQLETGGQFNGYPVVPAGDLGIKTGEIVREHRRGDSTSGQQPTVIFQMFSRIPRQAIQVRATDRVEKPGGLPAGAPREDADEGGGVT